MRATTLVLALCLMTFAIALAPSASAIDCDYVGGGPGESVACTGRCIVRNGVVECVIPQCPPYC